MSELVVRRLLIDLESPIPARWNGGDAFRSAWFNALSMSFPAGEQYFIDSVRAGLKQVDEPRRSELALEVQGFVGQEATHRRIHTLFNGHLERLGFKNTVELRAKRRFEANAYREIRVHVAATAATEHFTAMTANWMLNHPTVLEGSEARLKTLWLWHCSEEAEHRCTAFDMYNALNGTHTMRMRVYRFVTVMFIIDIARQTARNLWHDGSLFKWSTWRSAASLLLSKQGLFRSNYRQWRDYLAPDFHPSQHPIPLADQWLRDNRDQYTAVGAVSA